MRADRILLVLPSLGLGGAERVLLQLAELFLADGREVHVAALLGGGPLRSDLADAAVLHELVDAGGASKGLAMARKAFPKLVSLMRAVKPHAVLSSMTGTNLLAVVAHHCARCKGRLVLREESSAVNIRSALKRATLPMLYARADAIVAVSRGVARDMQRLGVARRRVYVIHNPIDVRRLRELAQIGSRLLDNGCGPYVMSLGRLTEAKDHSTLLRAYAMSDLCKTHRLVIVGEGERRAQIERLVHELAIDDRVLLPGAMDNPYRVLADASLHVLSSRWEGLGNVLLEAMALGVPVVSTDCPHGPCELLEDGRYGRLVPVGDPVALARAMEAELAQPSLGASELMASYDPTLIASRHLAVLDGEREAGSP